MPILEYKCRGCGCRFEFLRLPSTDRAPECPSCHSSELERLLSGFAINSRELSRARVRTAREQMTQSKDYKDKKIAEAEYFTEHAKEHGEDS